jgi:hypothetical protein
MMESMQSFKTNNNVTLKYFDTGAAEDGEDEKPWLILVRGFSFPLLDTCFCYCFVVQLKAIALIP